MDEVRRAPISKLPPRLAVIVVLGGLSAAIHAEQAVGQNLTGNVRLHDPSTIIEQDGRFYLFYTGNEVRSKVSDDLLDWDEGPRVFDGPPSWVASAVPGNSNANFWAPDVAYFNNQYHLYYSASTFGSQVSAIGLATSPTLDPSDPDYGWTDHGPVIQSQVGSPYNTIDPNIIQTTTGEVWMSFGSFWNGIYVVQIDPNTGKLPPRFLARNLARNASIEAPYIHERDGEFYLFVNWGSCCSGSNSTYNIRVGRSDSITGPYLDEDGVNMVSNGGTLFLGSEGDFIGPGHLSIFEQGGSEWFGYHYYDGDDRGRSKYNLREIVWTEEGWPVAGQAFSGLVPEPASIALWAAAIPLLLARGSRRSERCRC
jgi:arabinan endo-1,5-alpha-L-arabinosidase